MELSELKGLKKYDKLGLLRGKGRKIDELGHDVIQKLSTDVSPVVRSIIAEWSRFEDILHDMVYDKKRNWKKGSIVSYALKNLSDADKMEFIKSRTWQEPDFPYKDARFSIANGLYIHKKGNGFVPMIIKMAKEAPISHDILEKAHWDATPSELLEIITLTDTKHLQDIFSSSVMLNELPIKALRNVAIKKMDLNTNITLYPSQFFDKVLDDKLYSKLFNHEVKSKTINATSYEKRKAIFSNKDLTSKTWEHIFYTYIESDKILGSWRDYFLLLADIPLNSKMNGEIEDFIEYMQDTEGGGMADIVTPMIISYFENPTADKKIIDVLRNKYNTSMGDTVAALTKNTDFSDKEVGNITMDYAERGGKVEINLLDTFNNMMKEKHTPPRKELIEEVWQFIIKAPAMGFEAYGSSKTAIEIAISAFFIRGSEGNYGQKNSLPDDIRKEKSIEYFEKYGITDWIEYNDTFSKDFLEEL